MNINVLQKYKTAINKTINKISEILARFNKEAEKQSNAILKRIET